MRTRRDFMRAVVGVPMASALLGAGRGELRAEDQERAKIPVVHVTDLFHPPADPDDHFSLACMYALEELDLRGFILDMGMGQFDRTHALEVPAGRVPVEQLNHITGRKVPWIAGLGYGLRHRTDKGLDQEERFQGGVNMILSTLRESKEKVVLSTGASCRDIAAAFNREPDLLRRRVRAIYLNMGFANGERLSECNTKIDPLSYLRLLESGLPLYLCPNSEENHADFQFPLKPVLPHCSRRMQNFIAYALTRSMDNPIAALDSKAPLPDWSTVPWWPNAEGEWKLNPPGAAEDLGHMSDFLAILHMAGREIYERGPGDYVALAPAAAAKSGLSDKKVEVFEFVPVRVTLRPDSEPRHYPQPKLEDKPGQLRAGLWDWGQRHPAGLGAAATACVRVVGLESGKMVKHVVITSGAGSWRSDEGAKFLWPHWPLGIEQNGRALDCYFCWAVSGRHSVKVFYQDGTTASTEFEMPGMGAVPFNVDRNSPNPNYLQSHPISKEYVRIMTSCLRNLLVEL